MRLATVLIGTDHLNTLSGSYRRERDLVNAAFRKAIAKTPLQNVARLSYNLHCRNHRKMVVVTVSNCYHAYALVAHSIFVAIDPGRRVKQSQTESNISGLLGSQSCRGTAVIPLVS